MLVLEFKVRAKEQQYKAIIDSNLHFSVDQSSVELNPISLEKIAIATENNLKKSL